MGSKLCLNQNRRANNECAGCNTNIDLEYEECTPGEDCKSKKCADYCTRYDEWWWSK